MNEQIRLTETQVRALVAAAETQDYGAATHGTWYSLHRLGLIQGKHSANVTDKGLAWLLDHGHILSGN